MFSILPMLCTVNSTYYHLPVHLNALLISEQEDSVDIHQGSASCDLKARPGLYNKNRSYTQHKTLKKTLICCLKYNMEKK